MALRWINIGAGDLSETAFTFLFQNNPQVPRDRKILAEHLYIEVLFHFFAIG